jgi:hypothetical protein
VAFFVSNNYEIIHAANGANGKAVKSAAAAGKGEAAAAIAERPWNEGVGERPGKFPC